jgi:hypothetical protein
MFERRMEHVTHTFKTALEGNPLHTHYGVPGKYTWTRTSTATFQLDIERKYAVVVPLSLPDELCKLVSSFLYQDTTVSLLLTYTSAFASPRWTVLHSHSNLYINVEGIVKLHNRMYEQQWSPAVTMESDILYLLIELLPALSNGSIKN